MRAEPKERMAPVAFKAWRLSGFIKTLIGLIITLGLVDLCYRFGWPHFIWIGATLLTILEAIFVLFIIPRIRMSRWRYEVFPEEVDIQHGIFVTKRTLIPMVKVQHVDTQQGPILRKYGLATVTLATANGAHQIPALSQEVADQLRDQIARLARLTDDGL